MRPSLPQEIERMTLRGQISTQASAGRIADAQFPDQCCIMHSAPPEITDRIGALIQLLLIERRGLFEHSAGINFRVISIETSQALAEGQTAR